MCFTQVCSTACGFAFCGIRLVCSTISSYGVGPTATACCAKRKNAPTFGFPAIEPEGELIKIVAEMLVTHRALVGSINHRLRSETMRWTRGSSSEAVSFLPLRIVTSWR